jgi:hypothetical protein
MRIIKFIKILLAFVCAGIYGYSAIYVDRGQVYNISVDTGKPLSIVWPFEVAIIGDNGEGGLRIGPKIGRGWRGEAGGEASYRFYVPKDDRYHLWAYCLWFDECSNAIFAQIDGLDKAIIGNNPIYKQWHWVRSFDVHLRKGTHTLMLSNHSDHICLQKVLFTNSHFTMPEDCSLVFSDIFYDGFDGCDQGNLATWRIVSGEWIVQNPTQPMCLTENTLIGKSEDSAFIVYNNDDWSDYSLNIAIKPLVSENTNGSIGICFGLRDASQYHQLKWHHIEGLDKVKMEISRKTFEEIEVISNFEVPWDPDNWHHVEIALDANAIAVRVDDAEPFETPISYKILGGIGLQLEGRITAYFDDIHVRQIKGSIM